MAEHMAALGAPYRLSVKEYGDRWMGVITCGGHPVVEPGRECVVLDSIVLDNQEELTAWFHEQEKIEPWMPRQ